jgi:protein-S-isoprenylcysteine O-methyltransferase Ste14
LDHYGSIILAASAVLIAAHGVVMRRRQARREGGGPGRPVRRISPSSLFVWFSALSAGLEWLFPSGGTLTPAAIWLAAGVALAVVAECVMRAAARTLRRHATTQDCDRVADVLVADGLFRSTRNPIYLGMILLFLAVAVAAGSLWALALLPGYFLSLHLLVVRPEEEALQQRFGERYRHYAARVPRYF